MRRGLTGQRGPQATATVQAEMERRRQLEAGARGGRGGRGGRGRGRGRGHPASRGTHDAVADRAPTPTDATAIGTAIGADMLSPDQRRMLALELGR